MERNLDSPGRRNTKRPKSILAKNVGSKYKQHQKRRASVESKKNPDHTSAMSRLKKVNGQIRGIETMIEENRYCVDILIQFRAIAAALNVIESAILARHIKSCVIDAIRSRDDQVIDKKVAELIKLIAKRL